MYVRVDGKLEDLGYGDCVITSSYLDKFIDSEQKLARLKHKLAQAQAEYEVALLDYINLKQYLEGVIDE